MESESCAIIIFAVLIAVFFVLFAAKAIIFFRQFGDDAKYLKSEMRRAQNAGEYNYWFRELRCHYLCLIPFVNEKNVSGVYRVFFHKPRHAKKKNRDGIYRMLAPSLAGAGICAICLCGANWAWFSASVGSGVNAIKASEYTLEIKVEQTADTENNENFKIGDGIYSLSANTEYTVTVKAVGSPNATGYCKVKIGDTVYFTEQIPVYGNLSFTVKPDSNTKMSLTVGWGTCSVNQEERIKNGDELN